MDTMNITKIVGGLCGALLIYLMIHWGAETLYHTGGGHGAHGEEHAQGYKIEVADTTATGDPADGPSFEELLASADVAKGKKVFSKCKACHKLDDGANGTGPHLFNIVDREIGKTAGFSYSGGMSGIGGIWDIATLNAFIKKPKELIADTKMSFGGLKKDADRANLIAYLQTIK
ncbi:c-type cytochrome [Amylibacter sp. SFDW26]|uniref:c-type cytochrome n=1 Tax=Amylibacter sp. SFDW26 TaxID=2652722 RepID=UPI001261A2C9|nr:c-type cytochrome [Amylibacter sp. SFDW26]KAB7613394.1 c-type cytochrome [Amylibacter sp. SFDW26]